VDAIISLIRDILCQGSVQRIELDVNHPVRVVRGVVDGDPLMQEAQVGLEGQLRQVDITEYYSEEASPFQVVVDMMQLVHCERKYPVCWVVSVEGQGFLDEWLEWDIRGMPSGSSYLLGLPIKKVDGLTKDVLILCGSEYMGADVDELTLAVKTTMEIRSEDEQRDQPNREADDRVRDNSRGHASSIGQLALASRGLRKVERN
jgi:hypothetical protein